MLVIVDLRTGIGELNVLVKLSIIVDVMPIIVGIVNTGIIGVVVFDSVTDVPMVKIDTIIDRIMEMVVRGINP